MAQNKALTIFLSGLLLAALSFLFVVVTQKNFRAGTDLLVVQNQNGFTDYYALSKSADFLTNVLVQSIYSEKFISEVKNTDLVSLPFVSDNKLDAMKEWERIVKVSRDPNLGMVHIDVFANDQGQTVEISNAIINILTNKSYLFLGSGQDLQVRVLSGPIWEKNPSVSQIAITMFGGFFLGAILSFIRVYYRAVKNPEQVLNQYTKIENVTDEYEDSLKYLEK